VLLIEDATGAASEEVHRANIRDMQNVGVKIVKVTDLAAVFDAY
jgi:nicotinamidase-related amidase